MRLISLHDETVRLLERLRIPFDDLTPDGLWGSPYHLVGLTAEQRAVLDSWNLEVDDLTPTMMAGLGAPTNGQANDGRGPRRGQPASEARTEAPRDNGRAAAQQIAPEHATPMASEPKHHGDPLGDAAGEREMVGRAAAEAEAGVAVAHQDHTGNGGNGGNGAASSGVAGGAGGEAGTAPRDGLAKIRVSVGGKYREAAVKKGKIVLDGQSYDSPAQAAKSVNPAKGDWVFWEYFDAEAGKWRMLDRDWRPGAPT